MAKVWSWTALALLSSFTAVYGLPEPGRIAVKLSNHHSTGYLTKVSFNGSTVHLTADCHPVKASTKLNVTVEWRVKYSPCAGAFINMKAEYIDLAWNTHPPKDEIIVVGEPQPCSVMLKIPIFDGSRTVYEVAEKSSPATTIPAKEDNNVNKDKDTKDKDTKDLNCTLRKDGPHLLMIRIIPATAEDKKIDFTVEATLEIEKDGHFLSAAEWPLLVFYGVSSLLYLAFAIGWLLLSYWNWRELLRVQFWIGGVIVLGLLETAIFYSDYQYMNSTGLRAKTLDVTAEFVSSVKRTLARILVITVSLGYGIVKPRISAAVLHKVLLVGGIFFLLSIIDGLFRALTPKGTPTQLKAVVSIPLAVVNVAICWWIFSALVKTKRNLLTSENAVTLTIYRHFANTLKVLVIASLAFMLFSMKQEHYSGCYDWRNQWLQEAFWPFLFTIILFVIIILWRPSTINNQRYAFAPLLDLDQDDKDNQMLSEAFG